MGLAVYARGVPAPITNPKSSAVCPETGQGSISCCFSGPPRGTSLCPGPFPRAAPTASVPLVGTSGYRHPVLHQPPLSPAKLAVALATVCADLCAKNKGDLPRRPLPATPPPAEQFKGICLNNALWISPCAPQNFNPRRWMGRKLGKEGDPQKAATEESWGPAAILLCLSFPTCTSPARGTPRTTSGP